MDGLRDGNGDCIFCGGHALTQDAPCDCDGAMEEREILHCIDATKKKITKLFRDSREYQEQLSKEQLDWLYAQAEPLARRWGRAATVKVGFWNKATLKRKKKVISVKRTEVIEEEADDEEEAEE